LTTDVQDSPLAWVPVEHRWFGLDRRTFKPALIALAISLVLIYGWQVVNAAIPWHNEIKAGDVLDLGRGATAVPPVGWQLEDGQLTGRIPEASPTGFGVLLASGGATIELRGAPFTGTADAFLDRVQRANADDDPPAADGDRSTVTTEAGLVGVAQTRTSPGGDGLDVAFKMATGTAADAAPALLVRVRTTPGQLEQYRGQIQALLSSITPEVEQ
jgi:hypothetical protein